MSIRPIDMQSIVPRAVEAANERQGNIQRQMGEQNGYQQVAAKQEELKQTRVLQTNESHEMDKNVNKDGKNKQEHKKKDNKRRPKDEVPENKQSPLGLFDIKI